MPKAMQPMIPTPMRERQHLGTFVDDMARWGAETALVEHRGVRRYSTSYGELAARAQRFAAELVRRAIAPGERGVLWGANSAGWIAAYFGCVLRRVLPVPFDAMGGTEFARRVAVETAPRLVVGARLLLERSGMAEAGFREVLYFDELDTLNGHDEPTKKLPPSGPGSGPVLTPDSPLQILFTSGTMGMPKDVVHTHRNLLASLVPIEREIGKYRRYERWVHPLRFLHTLSLSHVFGQFMGLWAPSLLGAEVHYKGRGLRHDCWN